MQATDYLMHLNDRPAAPMTRGEGSYLWDAQGKRYLDFIQGWAVNCLGHSPEPVRRALVAQAEGLLNVGPAFYNQPAAHLAKALCELSTMARAFMSNSGAEANEVAVKVARRWGHTHRDGAFEVITALDSFHGRTLAMSAATGKPGLGDQFPPRTPGFVAVPYGDIRALRAAIGPRTAAIMLEPVQGEAGAVVPPPDYLRAVRQLCDEHGLLMVLDEIQTGMGRTGPLFAFEAHGVQPDVMTLGKGLGGGLPISATLVRDPSLCLAPGEHGGTFCGHPLNSAAALVVVQTLADPAQKLERERGSRRLKAVLQDVADRFALTLRGVGHLWGLVLPGPHAAQVVRAAHEAGLLLNESRANVVRLMPALNVTHDEINEMGAMLTALLEGCPWACGRTG